MKNPGAVCEIRCARRETLRRVNGNATKLDGGNFVTSMKRKRSRSYALALKQMARKQPDLQRAAGLLARAMKEEDPRATYALGTWYLHGRYFDKDERKGTRLIKAAASHGVADAMFDLAVSLEKGIGTKKNARRAALAYLRAALSGDEDAVYEVGRCLHHGIGFARDRLAAAVWYERARKAKSR